MPVNLHTNFYASQNSSTDSPARALTTQRQRHGAKFEQYPYRRRGELLHLASAPRLLRPAARIHRDREYRDQQLRRRTGHVRWRRSFRSSQSPERTNFTESCSNTRPIIIGGPRTCSSIPTRLLVPTRHSASTINLAARLAGPSNTTNCSLWNGLHLCVHECVSIFPIGKARESDPGNPARSLLSAHLFSLRYWTGSN